jgi:Domain of Unknown Function with PDB structure (DUF3857)
MHNKAYLIRGITVILVIIICCPILNAQDFKLDKVILKDVENNSYLKDTSANAIILYKSRQTYFETNKYGEWNTITEISKRVKILKKEGLQYGIEKIKLIRARDKRENIRGVKVTTYNLKRGKLISNKLKKGDILEDKISKDSIVVIFEAPKIKIGSIVDFKYKIKSPFFRISDLAIQENIPIKRYLANIKIPSYFSYRRLLIGNPKLKANESERFRDIKTVFTEKHFENAVGGGFKKVIKDSILQIKEHETQYELRNVPAFSKRELDNKKNCFRIIYELKSTNFSKKN